MTKQAAWLGLALTVLLLAVQPAASREFHPAKADDIVAALESAQAGDVVTLAPGTYTMPPIRLRQSGTAGNPITLRASHPGEVELRSSTTEFIKVSGSDWVFENLDIAGICAVDTDCEHAFHIVAGADRTVIRHNRIRDYNAHIKGNGEDGRFPNDVLIEDNWLIGTHHRDTDNPIAPIDVVGGKRWIVRGNLIADYGKSFDHPATRTDDFGYAIFFKGNSTDATVERNLVLCAYAMPPVSYTRGISLGGSATGPQYCEGNCDADEHRNGLVRNNVVLACPLQAGIYLFRAADSRVFGNTLIGTAGIEARGVGSTASVIDNLLGGGIVASEGASLTANNNLLVGPGGRSFDTLFADVREANLALRPGASIAAKATPLSDLPNDFCGRPRSAEGTPGAIDYHAPGNCDATEKLLAAYRAYTVQLHRAAR
jgi:hypothetical protein